MDLQPTGAIPSRWAHFLQRIGRLIRAALWIWAAALLLWNLLRIYPGDSWEVVRLGNYLAPWLFLLSAAALVAAAATRRPVLLAALTLVVLLFLLRFGTLLLPRSAPEPAAEGRTLRVMSFNVNIDNRNVREIAGLIRQEAPDLVALQEVHPDLFGSLQVELGGLYASFLLTHTAEMPLGLISRYTLTVQPSPEAAWPSQCALLELPEGVVTVWNLHPAFALTQDGWERQRRALQAVSRELAGDLPLLLLGNLNTNDQTDEYRLIAGYLTDVHRAVGRGFGFTYPDGAGLPSRLRWLRPLVRLDHIFAGQHMLPRQIRVVSESCGSDHRPVIADLIFRPGGSPR